MKPARDPKFLAWVRTQRCAVRGCQARFVEAAHTGSHGMGIKSSDRQAIPLCPRHHRTGDQSLHKLGARRFEQLHRIDIAAIVRKLNAKPQIRIEPGRAGSIYVAHFEGQQYNLGLTKCGLKPALRNMKELCCRDRLGMEIAS